MTTNWPPYVNRSPFSKSRGFDPGSPGLSVTSPGQLPPDLLQSQTTPPVYVPAPAGSNDPMTVLNLTMQQILALLQVAHQPINVIENMRYGYATTQPFTVGSTSDLVILEKSVSIRTLLIIQNTHATQDMFVSFGTTAASSIGLKLVAGGNLLLDTFIPQDDIHVIGSGAGTTGSLIYSNRETKNLYL